MHTEHPLIGFHASITGGLYKALEQAASLQCPTVQLFTKNNRSWNEPLLTKEIIDQFISSKNALHIKSVISHASYLINLASANPKTRHMSLKALEEEIKRSSLLAIDYVVLHPGSHTTLSIEQGIEYLIESCNRILESSESSVLLLETMAGQGSSIGKTFEQLAYILERIENKKRIGICLDTCHIFAAGYTATTDKDYLNLFKKFDESCGIHNLKVIHVNDSKKELGSHVDRHEHIGEGKIGINFFKNMMNDPHLEKIPKILETPKTSLEDDKRNIATLLGLINKNR